MDFSWTPEQTELRERIRDFAENELSLCPSESDRTGQFPSASWTQCAEIGLLRCNIPSAYGGSEQDVLTNVGMMEAFGYGCRDNALSLAVNAQVWPLHEPLIEFGSDEQKKTYLPALGAGTLAMADGITEAGAGSDAMSMQTTAKKAGEGYVLNGSKSYISFAPIADVFLVFAKTDPEAGSWGISAFLVERDTEGLSLSSPREKMGLRSLPVGDLTFEDCFVPASQRLGNEGAGLRIFLHSLEYERGFILASHVGSMARQLDGCVAYARERKQFGKSILDFQSVSNRLADMQLRLETSRLLLYKAAWLKHRGKRAAMASTLVKLHISESFLQSSLEAMRIHGAKGYLSEFEIERDVRDAAGGVIYAGTSDILRNTIVRSLTH